jgi:hypothetical protein
MIKDKAAVLATNTCVMGLQSNCIVPIGFKIILQVLPKRTNGLPTVAIKVFGSLFVSDKNAYPVRSRLH